MHAPGHVNVHRSTHTACLAAFPFINVIVFTINIYHVCLCGTYMCILVYIVQGD